MCLFLFVRSGSCSQVRDGDGESIVLHETKMKF